MSFGMTEIDIFLSFEIMYLTASFVVTKIFVKSNDFSNENFLNDLTICSLKRLKLLI